MERMKTNRWRRKPPDDIGYWLRINAINRPTITFAVRIDGVLNVSWGGGETALIKADHPKMKGWWWKKLNLPKGVSPNAVWEYGK